MHFWPMLHNYTGECILIGSVFMQNYYQCPSEATVKRRGREKGMWGGVSLASIYTWMRRANNTERRAGSGCGEWERKVEHAQADFECMKM